MKKLMTLVTAIAITTGCGGGEDYINLDGVFDAFIASVTVIESQMPPPSPVQVPDETAEVKEGEEPPMKTIDLTEPDPEREKSPEIEDAFLKTFSLALNQSPEATGYGTPLGVKLQDDGSFKGFDDPNQNNKQDAGEKDVFLLEIDWDNERLIATDLQHEGYHRDHTYRRSGLGLMSGYLVGRMIGGQRAAGVTPAKRFGGMKMKSKGYHSNVSGAKRYSSGARSSGGSRGYRGGK